MIYHQGTKILEGEHLLLRPFQKGDGNAMFQNWAADEKTVAWLLWNAYESEAAAERRVTQWAAQYTLENLYHWAIVPKDLGEPIGSISVARIDDLCESAELGYCLGSKWWNQGYATEALGLVVHYLFGEVGFHRLEGKHAIENEISHKVMLKAGMLQEGILRGAYKNKDGSFSDMVINGMTKEDWEVL